MQQTFGVQVTKIAMRSKSVFQELLSLSAITLSMKHTQMDGPDTPSGLWHLENICEAHNIDNMMEVPCDDLLSEVLRRACYSVANLQKYAKTPRLRREPDLGHIDVLVSQVSDPGLNSRIYWLILRLGI